MAELAGPTYVGDLQGDGGTWEDPAPGNFGSWGTVYDPPTITTAPTGSDAGSGEPVVYLDPRTIQEPAPTPAPATGSPCATCGPTPSPTAPGPTVGPIAAGPGPSAPALAVAGMDGAPSFAEVEAFAKGLPWWVWLLLFVLLTRK